MQTSDTSGIDMIAVEVSEPGAPEVLKAVSRPRPVPGPGEVLIKVAAAGVNRPDVLQRTGHYPPPPGASDLPGLEVAGEIVALGDGVSERKVGERVCALVAGGGYAQYCVAAGDLSLPIPEGMSDVEAAAIPETFYTVWTNVFQRARLQPGEVLLVHGGSSGIGTTAIQLAREHGATVYVTAGSDEKCAACEKLGATVAINYRREDFVERIRALTDRRGVDVLLDMVAGDYFPRNLKSLAVEGRLVQIALQRGARSEIDLGRLMVKRLTVTGSTLRPRSVAEKAVIATELRQKVWPMFESGTIKPIIHATFPLADAAGAHALMETSTHIGKIMLVAD
jgi:NADPH2:quinone reductase